jgi:dolichyl-phosphate beta-glucosyltransferase
MTGVRDVGYPATAVDVSIVVPAYNEQSRIGASLATMSRFLDGRPERIDILVVDDGSRDATADLVRAAAARDPRIQLLVAPRNEGKGAAVRRGMLAARGDVIVFTDADLSVPIDFLPRFLEAMERTRCPVVIGSRRAPGASIAIRQPRLRQSLGHVFTFLTRVTLVWEVLDFTCGFKAFRRDAARAIFTAQRQPDWSFDAEILYLAKLLDIPVHQEPVRWEHREGSRVRFPRDLIRTLIALAQIRIRAPRAVRLLRARPVPRVPEGIGRT